ncbi:hypothetical protein FRC04_008033 [Tulasnella sp. 424]|nr:hypothetical protein FRC04_008033 [Tulasnella sp. 424]KAG8959353.1 hypothetical protein FRC05_007901 [Tulasnella sp. 425]
MGASEAAFASLEKKVNSCFQEIQQVGHDLEQILLLVESRAQVSTPVQTIFEEVRTTLAAPMPTFSSIIRTRTDLGSQLEDEGKSGDLGSQLEGEGRSVDAGSQLEDEASSGKGQVSLQPISVLFDWTACLGLSWSGLTITSFNLSRVGSSLWLLFVAVAIASAWYAMAACLIVLAKPLLFNDSLLGLVLV